RTGWTTSTRSSAASRSPIPIASFPRRWRPTRERPFGLSDLAVDGFDRPRSRVPGVPRRGGIAHPGLLGEPFMLGAADRAIYPRKKFRHRLEAFVICNDPGRNFPSRLWTADHDNAHQPLPGLVLFAGSYRRVL